jgi:TPR repeat protein
MYRDVDWTSEPDLEELRTAHSMLTTNFELAHSRLERLAEKGSTASMWYLGDAFASGRNTSKNLDKAKFWYEKAEQRGWIAASYRLGRICFELQDYKGAFDAFSRGSAINYTPAIYRLAWMYKEGLGAAKDANECRRLLSVAQSRGHLFAKRDLSGMYMGGSFGISQIPTGILMFFSLVADVVVITAKRDWDNPRIEERVLA